MATPQNAKVQNVAKFRVFRHSSAKQ